MKMISIPVAVHTDVFKMQLDLFWFNHQLTYGADAAARARAIIIKKNYLNDTPHECLKWPIDVPHIMCESVLDILPPNKAVRDLGYVALPMNIQLGLSQILHTMDDEQLIELTDCDMFHFRPAPPMAVDDDELIVSDLYENWHLKSLTDNKHIIEPYFKNKGRYYNGGFVPIIGKVKTFRKILADWIDLHIDILQQNHDKDTNWWAGMFALQAACERACVVMIARDLCYIPSFNQLQDGHYICHYSVDTRFNKKTYPNINVSTFEQNIFYERILLWLEARDSPALTQLKGPSTSSANKGGSEALTEFDQSWQDWLQTCFDQTCDPMEVAKILLTHHFSVQLIEKTLSINLGENHVEGNTPGQLSQHPAQEQGIYLPQALKINTGGKLDLSVIDNFLNAEECIRLIESMRHNLRPSTVVDYGGDITNFRTSRSSDLADLQDAFIQEIDRRICATIGISPYHSQGIQAQWYDVGEEFRPHYDYSPPDTLKKLQNGAAIGQRSWTFMIYLNTTMEGGSTAFTRVDQEFFPVAGRALIWNNLYEDGTPNPNSMHGGMPVKKGFKAIITKWFNQTGHGARFSKVAGEYLPTYTHAGFVKLKIPPTLFEKLLGFYKTNLHKSQDERVKGFISGKEEATRAPSELVILSEELKALSHTTLQPLVEAWIGHFVEPTYVYGIRRYLDTAGLELHRDRDVSHIASCILNISQDVQAPWPLLIEDHNYRRHQVYLQPGEMIFYEGAKLLHGRPEKLHGEHFANIFVHFKVI